MPSLTASLMVSVFDGTRRPISSGVDLRVRLIDGADCLLVEPDIDYYEDQAAHFLLEVIPGTFFGSMTDPKTVYALRWMASRHGGVPAFEPPYTIG